MSDAYDQDVYFIGVALPTEFDRLVSRVQWEIHERDKSTFKPLLPHVTLLSPPSLRGVMPDELLPRIREVAKRYLPLTIAAQEIGFFRDRTCYIRVQSQGLLSLQSQLVRLLPLEAQTLHYRRPFLPHITIAQAFEPHALDVEALRRDLQRELNLPRQFKVDAVSYFQRILPRMYRADQI